MLTLHQKFRFSSLKLGLLIFMSSLLTQELRGQNFQVSGTKILDPEGLEFVARGVNVGGYNYNKSAGNTLDDLELIVDTWQFNLVRVNCKMFFNQYGYGYTGNNDMKAIIDAFTARKVVVLIDGGHEKIGSFYEGDELDSLKRFYHDLAVYSKDNPYVWFDLANEPDNNYQRAGDRLRWTTMMQELILSVRETGNENLLLVCGGSWGQDAGGGGCNNVPDAWSHILSWHDEVMEFGGKKYENIAFTFHIYNSWNCSRTRLADYIDRILAKDLAVVVGEYGSENEDNTTIQATRHMFDVCKPRKIGRVVWHWSNGDDNDLVKKVAGSTRGTNNNGGGREINDLDHPTNLTELGKLVWQDTHSTVTGLNLPKDPAREKVKLYFDRDRLLNIELLNQVPSNEPSTLTLYGLSGRVLYQQQISLLNSPVSRLEISLPQGIYLARFETRNYIYNQKLLYH